VSPSGPGGPRSDLTRPQPARSSPARSTPGRPQGSRATLGAFLTRGLLAGLVAGLASFGVAYVVGEPALTAAIAVEDGTDPGQADGSEHEHPGTAGSGHEHAADGTVVPRSLQSTVGLATGTVVAGVTLGGFLGLLTALALGRLGRTGPRATALGLAAGGFVSVQLVPFAAYPPNPPGVGDPATIGLRTASYAVLLAISVIAASAALLGGRGLRPRWGSWYAGVATAVGYLLVVCIVIALLPGFDEVPADYPATLLYRFRAAGLLTQLTLWGVLGLALAELTGRLVAHPASATGSLLPVGT